MSHSSETSKRTGKMKNKIIVKQPLCTHSIRLGNSSFVLPHHKLLEDVGKRIVSLSLDKKLGKISFLECLVFFFKCV